MVSSIVRSVSGRAKGCQSSTGRTFVLSQWQQPHERIAAPSPNKINSKDAADQGKGHDNLEPYWRSKTSLAFTCPVSTSWIAELTSSSWRRS
jgi:hypothetical protein